jgi:hypothetical protein
VVLTVSKEAVAVSARTEQLIYAAALFSLSSDVLMGLAVPLLAVERGLTPNTLGILLAIATVGPVAYPLIASLVGLFAFALVPLFQNIWLIAALSLIHGFMLDISLPLLLTASA